MKTFFFFLLIILNLSSITLYSGDSKEGIADITGSPDDIYWDNSFGNPIASTPEVRSALVMNNGQKDDLYIYEDGHISFYDSKTNNWKIIGIVGQGLVFSIVKYNDLIYIGGSFQGIETSPAKFIAVWNGSKWDTVGKGLNGRVNSMTVGSDGKLYIGGEFTKAGDSEASNIVAWDGSNWTALGDGLDKSVRVIIAGKDKIYAGGDFNFSNDIELNKVAYWDQNAKAWKDIGGGISSDDQSAIIMSLALNSGNELYAGGLFNKAGNTPAQNIAKWNGSRWDSIGAGFDNIVNSILVGNNEVYAGGFFTSSGDQSVNKIAKWNGTGWMPVLDGVGGTPYPSVLGIFPGVDNSIYIGGTFNKAGSVDCNGFVKYDGNSWIDMFPNGRKGILSSAADMTTDTNNNLCLVGGFPKTGNVFSRGIVKWNGDNWVPMHIGFAPPAIGYSVKSYKDYIYFTGWFLSADSIKLNNVARWSNTLETWEPVGRGIDGAEFTLGPIEVINENDIYVGGNFMVSGGDTLRHLAHWNGSVWESVGGGVSYNDSLGRPYTIGHINDDIIIAGYFNKAGNMAVNNIAVWHSSSSTWDSLGSGVQGTIECLLINGDSIIVGGTFTKTGDTTIRSIAVWNMQTKSWYPFGGKIYGTVSAIHKYMGEYYIGGSFSRAGNINASSIVKYNPQTNQFFPLGSGLQYGLRTGRVSTIRAYKNKLYVGGLFTGAGGKLASNFVRWSNIPLGVEEANNKLIEQIKLTVAPNPAHDKIFLDINSETDKTVQIELVNNLGQVVKYIKNYEIAMGANNIEIDANGLESGLYFCNIKAGSFNLTEKVIVLK